MTNILNFISNSFELEACFKLLLGAFLAGIIGYERESWKKPAGIRTHILVGESAVMIMLCGIYLSKTIEGADPSRIPAQLLSGIGFIGAGTILRDGFHVKGLTTAASLLAVTGIGLIVGTGAYIVAIVSTFFIYIILSYSYKLSDAAEKFDEFDFKIYSDNIDKNLKQIEKIFVQDEIILKRIKVESDHIRVKGKILERLNKNRLITGIMKLEGIKEVIEE